MLPMFRTASLKRQYTSTRLYSFTPQMTRENEFYVEWSVHRVICVNNYPKKDAMQQYTIYLYLQTALHVSGGISTHYLELTSLYLQYLALLGPLLLLVVNMAVAVTVHVMPDTVGTVI